MSTASLTSCLALALRQPGTLSMGVLVPVGLLGAFGAVPTAAGPPADRGSDPVVAALGLVPFVVIRLLGPPLPAEITRFTVLATTAAAIAEEALFRRFLYGWLAHWGQPVALVGSALLFAIIHVPVYGPGVIFIDFGAGLIFGYQRWVTGSWGAPAATHALANLLQLPWLT